jgi:hypothetical protein
LRRRRAFLTLGVGDCRPHENRQPEMHPMSETAPNPTRREFAKAALAAAALPVLAPLASCAPHPQAAPAPAPAPAASPAAAAAGAPVAPSAPPQAGAQQQAPDPVAVHLTEALKAKYRERLTDAQWEDVRKAVQGNLRAAKALRDFAIPIQTEPAFVFRAYRGGER